MNFELAMNFDHKYRFLKCSILADTSDVNCKACTFKGKHTFKRGYML